MNVRFITHKGVKYLRVEDIVDVLRELGATEETDTRKRIETLASSLLTHNVRLDRQEEARTGKTNRIGSSGNCIGCLVELGALDDDPNGDGNCVCAKCRAEDRHDFDAEPQARYDRVGRRIDTANEKVEAPK